MMRAEESAPLCPKNCLLILCALRVSNVFLVPTDNLLVLVELFPFPVVVVVWEAVDEAAPESVGSR